MSEIDRSTQARGQRRALEQVVVAHVLANSAGGYQLIFHRHAHEQPVGASLPRELLKSSRASSLLQSGLLSEIDRSIQARGQRRAL